MPIIDVSPAQFERFQKFALPFVDTHESAFEKVLKLAESAISPGQPTSAGDAHHYGITSLPDLKHTTITGIRIGSKLLPINYWNAALIEVLKLVKSKAPLLEATVALPVNVSSQKKTVHGYKWHEELGVSVQGVAATEAAKTILGLGEKYDLPIEIDFFWQNKPEAAHPGRKGKLATS